MAKPIRATPKLTAEETETFLKCMIKVDKSKIKLSDKNLAKELINNGFSFCQI